VYGQFPSEGDDQFIGAFLVDEAMKRPQYQDASAPIVIGVDPARYYVYNCAKGIPASVKTAP
jgi:hypothetical protein